MPRAKAAAKATDNSSRLKRKGAGTGRKQTKKAAKDPNKPKRPPSAFFVFMSEFRETYNKEHPENKSVSVVGKAAGDRWKSMSDAEKAPFIAKAEKKKQEYEKTLKRLAEGKNLKDEEESDKSKSEVNDEDGGDESGEGEEDDD